MAKKPIRLSEEEIRHIERLRKRPELRERIAAIMEIIPTSRTGVV